MGELVGRVALVTGASRGIGAAIARRLAAEGAAVAVTARTIEEHPRLPGSLRETVATIEADGGRAVAIAADLADGDDRARIAGDVEAQLGPVDVLVNNAAAAFYLPIDAFPLKRRRILFELNFHAPVDLAVAVLPAMRARGAGWIVNVSSVTSRHPQGPPYRRGSEPTATATIYGASKAALERFTTGLAAEVYGDGIAVNSLAPKDVVPTPGTLFHHLTTMDDPRAEQPEVMAEAALALCREPATKPDGSVGLTGRVVYSQDLLAELGVPVA
jgi:NAD(P)-dependent dehydrogenase (short-subunit alcohol dehydrogenase family)